MGAAENVLLSSDYFFVGGKDAFFGLSFGDFYAAHFTLNEDAHFQFSFQLFSQEFFFQLGELLVSFLYVLQLGFQPFVSLDQLLRYR